MLRRLLNSATPVLRRWPLQRTAVRLLSIPIPQTMPAKQPSVTPIARPATPLSAKTILQQDINQFIKDITTLVSVDHPTLSSIAKYYFSMPGKLLRPSLVMLISRAISPTGELNWQQRHLAQIVELIHTASLIHDDILDDAPERRGHPSITKLYGPKLAVLGGDFLLARASVCLSGLKHHEVTRLMSTTIANLVEGEFLQMKPTDKTSWERYMRKTYLKTVSLIENGTRSAALLSSAAPSSPTDASITYHPPNEHTLDIATRYGSHLGYAFQLIDDLLDFTESRETLGKPAGVDMRLGLSNAPVLYALEEYPDELRPLIERGFAMEGDVEKALDIVRNSTGLVRTKELAESHSHKAMEAAFALPPSPARDELVDMANKVVERKK